MTNIKRRFLSSKTPQELSDIGKTAEHLRDISDPWTDNWYKALSYIFEIIAYRAYMERQMNQLLQQAKTIIRK